MHQPVAEPRSLAADWSTQAAVMGLIVAIVGYGSSVAIVVQGLTSVGATREQVISGLILVSLAKGLVAVWASWTTRMPISIAWTTPGLALVATTGAMAGGFPAAVGAFIVAALAIAVTGVWKPLGELVARIPKPIANAMLAGVLFKFCLAPFVALGQVPLTALAVLVVFLVMTRVAKLYAVPVAVVVALVATALTSGGAAMPAQVLPHVEFVAPVFALDALISIALPLYLVTMASQNIPGITVLHTFGYQPNAGKILMATGLASAGTALGGAPTINFAAITAAMCAGPDAHPDPARRYIAGIMAGVGYMTLGLFSAITVSVMLGSPPVLILAVAGLALLGSFGGALNAALGDETMRLPAMATLLTTASGLSIFGVGSAFWGLVIGVAFAVVLRWR
ncbi:benzoate/H(+) symporter BenE family transporter [Variibacter gotjawalensis]|uniref:benzoate/H(+) symporter BenE family transporter n=1 Tax=Variibacter gotjawalensis TaxID=1333996 RepID=UPI001D366FAF|nr:benzoate/H(+) symporter BenE family transporter [Variibacter gotjawalensis]NIK46519.1 benzoate membrane transport protein [Variibacter gotjawalensis]